MRFFFTSSEIRWIFFIVYCVYIMFYSWSAKCEMTQLQNLCLINLTLTHFYTFRIWRFTKNKIRRWFNMFIFFIQEKSVFSTQIFIVVLISRFFLSMSLNSLFIFALFIVLFPLFVKKIECLLICCTLPRLNWFFHTSTQFFSVYLGVWYKMNNRIRNHHKLEDR